MRTLTTLILATTLTLTLGCSATGAARADDDLFTQAELDRMLAPVALYPDSVLSHVLIAATYPLEVIQAARWSREHPGLEGEAAVDAVGYKDWDPSVKALVAFPRLLERMDADIEWTQRLGDAFLYQEADVIASIQYLRSEAYAKRKLRSNDYVKVIREREYIYIEPVRPHRVYVPYYDTRVVFADWRWHRHEPVWWHRPTGFGLNVSFYWGRPYHIHRNFYFSSFHWPKRRVVVVNNYHYERNYHFYSGRHVVNNIHHHHDVEVHHWRHDPQHRRGVSYRRKLDESRVVNRAAGHSSHASTGSRSSSSSAARSAVTRSATTASASTRSAVTERRAPASRESKRNWAAERRSGGIDFDRSAASRATTRSSSASRSAETRQSSRVATRASTTRSASGRSERSSVYGRSDRASRVTESLPSSSRSSSARAASDRTTAPSRSREAISSRSRSSVRVPETLSSSRSGSSASSSARLSRSSGRAGLSSSSARTRPAPDRSPGSTRAKRSAREAGPRASSSRASSSRSTPRVRSSSAPSRSSSTAPARSSRSASPRSSRGSAESRRGGRGDDERR